MDGISRDTFVEMDVNSKLNVLFDYAVLGHEYACTTREKLIVLEKKVSSRKRIDSTVAGMMGFVGGLVAVVAKWVMGK